MPGSILIGDFVPSSDLKTWTLPSSAAYEWSDGNGIFTLAATITAEPTDKTTCDFALTHVAWGVNDSYSYPGDIRALIAQEIRATVLPGAQKVDGVMPYPQPAKNSVRFLYDLDSVSTVEISVYDVAAQKVASFLESDKPAGGRQSTVWDTSHVPAGVYYAVTKIKPVDGSERIYKKKVYIEH